MRSLKGFVLALVLLMSGQTAVLAATLSGVVHENGHGSRPIAGASLVFTNSITSAQSAVASAADGSYSAVLSPGQYYVTVLHPSFETATTNWARLKIASSKAVLSQDFVLKNSNKNALSAFIGWVYEYDGDCRGVGYGPGTRIDFTSEDQSRHYSVMSDAFASYRINLPPGRYYVTASRSGRYSSDSAPGFFEKFPAQLQTGNIELNRDAPKKCL